MERILQTDVVAKTAGGNGTSPPAAGTGATWADVSAILGEITWAWKNWLPNGMLTLLVGKQETGKSILALRVASCFLRGDPWPDGAPFEGEKGHVLWVETEASQGLNVERAQLWGLPLDRILTPFNDPLADAILDSPEHQKAVIAKAKLPQVRLVVVDSLSGGNRRDENRAGMMATVKWLAALARDNGKPSLLIHHLRKRGLFDVGDAVKLDMVRGSSTITQPARAVWAVDQPNLNTETRRLSVIKFNLGRKPEPVGMIIGDKGVTFTETPERPRQETRLDQAIDLLKALLASGPVATTELQEEANGAGISWDTIKRAKEKLGVVAKRDGKARKWFWALPATETIA